MRILILGAGGVGGYFGARLIEAGADVTFLVRDARARLLAAEGLRVESPHGDLRLPVRTVTDAAAFPDADLILLSCKAYDLDSALDAIAPAVRPGVALAPLLNGMAHIDRIGRRFPEAEHWGGVAQIAATLTPDGIVRHLGEMNAIMVGRLGGAAGDGPERFAALFDGTPVDARARPKIEQDLWNKLVFLATLAGATCLMRASVGVILETDAGARLIDQLLDECARIATAEGFPPEPERMEGYGAILHHAGSPMTASMLRDIERGGPTECEHIHGDLLARARAHGLPAPLLEIAHAHLQAHERRRAAPAS